MPRVLEPLLTRGCAAALLAAVTVALANPVVADDRCYGDWSDAAPVVAREKLRSARDVQELARGQLDSDVVRIVLCRHENDFVYRIVLRRSDGRIGNLVLGATSLATR